jgi:type I restriction enzyme S subunit
MPKLFDYGQLPAGWSVRSLSTLTASDRPIVYGIVQAGPHWPGGVPYLRSTDVGSDIDVDSLPRTNPAIAQKYRRAEVRPGDLVFSLRGNIGEMSIVPDRLPAANLTQGTARISTNGVASCQYIRFALSSQIAVSSIDAVAKGSTFREISIEELRKVSIPVPPVDEQQAIVCLLSTWDRGIRQLSDLIAAKVRFKQGLMQQLLTGIRRFPDFNGNWQEYRLGDLFDEREESNCIDLPLLSITADRGVIPRGDIDRKDNSSENKSLYKRIAIGDIGYNTMRMWQGVSAISRLDGIVSPAYTVCIPKSEVDSDFAA